MTTTLAVSLSACATDTVSRAELSELTASVRALRAENARLDSRLERMEQQLAVASARSVPGRPVASTATPAAATPAAKPVAKEELPPLTVVKLKPRKEAAPKLATEVAVVEPEPEVITDLKAAQLTAGDAAPQGEADAIAADQQFAAGNEALNTGNAEGGISQLLQFATDWPRHPKADNALYLAGLGMMALKDFEQAQRTFEQISARYPAGDVVLDSMLKLAECRVKLNKTREARATWEKIVASFPGTAAATQAQSRLAALSTSSAAPTP